MRRLLILLALVLAPLAAAAQDFPALHRVSGVAPGDVLNIRAAPGVQGAVMGSFARDAADIEVLALSPDQRWGLVRVGEQAGWSAMRYLRRQRTDSWRDGQQALACLGTEPFWRLDLFLPDNRAEYIAPETSFEMRTDAPNLPRTEFPPTLALPFQGAREGVAVVRGGLCSDGMSDVPYGLQVQVYWRGDAAGLSGCCRLAP